MKAPHETTESVSARFLRARKYDLDKAIEMMTNCAAWRKKTNPRQFVGMLSSKVIDAHVSELQRFYPHAYVDLCDEQYRPVYFEKTGAIDTAGLLAITSQQKLLEWHMQMLEEFNQARMSACTQIRKDDVRLKHSGRCARVVTALGCHAIHRAPSISELQPAACHSHSFPPPGPSPCHPLHHRIRSSHRLHSSHRRTAA